MQTQGEKYEYKPGERENIEKLNVILREAYAKLMEAKKFVEDTEAASATDVGYGKWPTIYWGFDFDWDTDENGDPKLPTNYDTTAAISVFIRDEWMSSTNDC